MTLENRVNRVGNENGNISMHILSAGLTLWGAGEVTRAQLITFFNLDATEQTQIDEIKSKYDGLNNFAKAGFHGTVEAANIAFENAAIDETKWKSILGIVT